jgi:hypothetical protein
MDVQPFALRILARAHPQNQLWDQASIAVTATFSN